ncbi:hypothetical protein CA12_14400 [Alienimonas californiensis]|uniref:Uncharacterized protein n=2 Tax=Alienimonas californiensis TaxID=2527989 RepID=A0A517P7M2_9PLAN|nr:hypothetical protein CA12_14400 [Alienimonas californiensis]
MARRLRATPRGRRAAARLGVTLTEVLMSLLVMGIGVTSVATLFPLAVLRGARATQLTAGTILKVNAEETVRFSHTPSLEAPLPKQIGGVLLKGGVSAFPRGASPGVERLAMLLDPDANGSLDVCGAATKVSPTNTLAWGPGGAFLGNGGTPRKYVVDPLGAAVLAGDTSDAVSPWFYGAKATAGSAATDQFGAALGGEPALRFAWPFPWEMVNAAESGNSAVRRQMVETAYNVVGRAGDYSSDLDVDASATLNAAGTVTITFSNRDVENGALEEFYDQNNATAEGLAVPGADLARIVLFAPDQRSSAAIPLARLPEAEVRAGAAPDDVTDVADGYTLTVHTPNAGFQAAAFDTDGDGVANTGANVPLRVRLERPDRRYSWMLTCRRTGSERTEAEVAVFFNRALSAEDESVWRSVRTASGSYVLFWDTGSATPQRNPQVVGGGWLLEMGEFAWLQVGRVLEAEGDPTDADAPQRVKDAYSRAGGGMTTPRYLEFLLSSGTPRRNEAGMGGNLFATFPRGVVSVFTLDP